MVYTPVITVFEPGMLAAASVFAIDASFIAITVGIVAVGIVAVVAFETVTVTESDHLMMVTVVAVRTSSYLHSSQPSDSRLIAMQESSF